MLFAERSDDALFDRGQSKRGRDRARQTGDEKGNFGPNLPLQQNQSTESSASEMATFAQGGKM